MSRLTRDGTAEPVSRDQILRHARGQGNVHFPCSADHEQDWQPYPVDPYSAICDDHTYIHTRHACSLLFFFLCYIAPHVNTHAPQEEATKRAEIEEFVRAGEEALRIMREAKEVRAGVSQPGSRWSGVIALM